VEQSLKSAKELRSHDSIGPGMNCNRKSASQM
jgi:hypothetical protein